MPNHVSDTKRVIKAAKNVHKRFFTNQLLKWNQTDNGRKMPWKGEKNPYRIWLSEIILQQTRVEQGWLYYDRFVQKYPTISNLAAAKDEEVFKLWEGLGYYSRCKNLLASARQVMQDFDGAFPGNYEDILSLKGVGPYTAAAIASFAFDLPHAVLDGNVYRVLSRYFAIDQPIDGSEGKKYFSRLASDLLDNSQPGIYNQAIMDFGATVCKPQPSCNSCVLNSRCLAYNSGTVGLYPLKSRKIKKKTRWLNYVIVEHGNCIAARKRSEKDIWQNLHEFILTESLHELSTEELLLPLLQEPGVKYRLLDASTVQSQQLTHQTIKGKFIHVELFQPASFAGYHFSSKPALSQLAFPRFITNYLQESRLF